MLTSGVANLDFVLADTGTCTAGNSMVAGQTCAVKVLFRPRFPGVRQGAVVLSSGSGMLASARLSGIGQGGLPVLMPGRITTVAGNGQWVYRADNVAATAASIFLPTGLAVDGAGNLFFCDSSNNRVRRVDAATGTITTVAGDGTPGSAGDSGPAASAELNNPSGLALDGAGDLYIADTGNNLIRRVDAISSTITTIAGKSGASGYAGDGGRAVNATLTSPQGVALTPAGDLVIADTGDAVVRLLTLANGQIQLLAGTGQAGYNGDGIAAITARLNSPWGVAVRADGAVAIADFGNERVRLVDASGNITTMAGTGQRGFSGDGDAASMAMLSEPAAVAFDPAGDLLIADSGNNRVRGVYGAGSTITTLAGNSSEEFAGDGGAASSASLYGPYALLFDPQGNIWISDMFHNRVRQINGSLLGISYPPMRVGKQSSPVAAAMYNAGNEKLTLAAPVLNQGALDPGTTTCGQAALAPMIFCNMGVAFAPTQVGQTVLGSVSWPSDAPNVTPVDDLSGQVLSVEPTSVALSADSNPGLLGHPITLTATVTSADTNRTGTVTFTEGNQVWCTAVPLSRAGTAPCVVPSLSLGSHTFSASYSGDDNNAASTAPSFTEVIKQQPALALAVSSSPAAVTSAITLTLSAVDQTGTPTGTVIFYDGATALATVSLNGAGVASLSTSALSVGTHNLSAQYSGDGANVAGTSNLVAEQITQATTITLLSSSSASVPVGTAIVFIATVLDEQGPAPTGSVQFTDGNGAGAPLLGVAPLTTNGTAAITISTLAPGLHRIIANYSGDTDDAPSTSAALGQTVQQIATITTLSGDSDPLNAGATLHLSASVILAPGATPDGALAGTVSFRDGATVLGAATLSANGQATLAVSNLPVGPHSLTGVFSGNTNYAAGTSAVLLEVVQQTPTQVAFSANSATTLVGKPVSFTVVVTSTTGVPSGTVLFRDGTGPNAGVVGSATLDANGRANLATERLTPGSHTIVAVYSGDANYLPATSAGLQQSVQLAQPVLTLSGPAQTVDAGTVVQLFAGLAAPGVAPTGTLTLLDGATATSTLPLGTSNTYVFSTATLTLGSHLLRMSYSGDAANASAISAAVTVVVQQAPSTTSLSASANPLTQGGLLSLTATVVSESPNLSGSVRFFDGPKLLGSAPLASNGSASFSAAGFGLGTHTLVAVYTGDTNHAGSNSGPFPELVVQSSSATLSSSNNPSASGQNVTFTAQVSGVGALVPTGAVTFRDNGALLATVPLHGGGATSFSTTALAVGTHTITVSYAGDTNFASAAAQLLQTVVNASTQVTISSSANPAIYGQPLILSANVVSNGGVATGNVVFTEGNAPIGSAPLNANGSAALSSVQFSPGSHIVEANYPGDGKASPSVSTPLLFVVKQTTVLAVQSDGSPTQTLSAVTFTAVLRNAGAAAATGTVSFAEGTTVLGTAPVDGNSRAAMTLPQMSAGTHVIVASYAGDGANFSSSSPSFTQVVQLRPTVITVTGSSTDAANPQQITLIAVVRGQGSLPPSGNVTFASGLVTLGVAAVDATGVAALTVIFEQKAEPVVATYAGDLSYAASQSSATTITAGEAAQFTLTVNVPTITLVTHQHASVNVSLGSVKGFSDTVALGCLGLPFAATCTFDRDQLKLGADGTAIATLIVDTGDPLGAGSGTNASLPSGRGTTLFCLLPAGLLLGLFGGSKARKAGLRLGAALGTVGALAIVFALTVGATGCSGLHTSGTPPGTYTFKVVGTGQGSGATQAQTVTLVVTQ